MVSLEDLKRRASTGQARLKRRYSRRMSSPAPVPEVPEDQEDHLEFLMQHQQDKLMYSKLKSQLEHKHAYMASLCVGLCFGSAVALVLRFCVALVRFVFGFLWDM